jgi:hypothetical protein
MATSKDSGEVFYVDAHGKKCDAEIHDHIINTADRAAVAKHEARSKARLAKYGMNPETIKRLFGET